ncbi:MAG TPA: sigma-70 family RNA polymerase sigma factor, partial [Solirubrobacteraceae bacterium]|nr:sigma-70 family RNA polymerase sigma factor [Solirubrobacteraceae bacterium]
MSDFSTNTPTIDPQAAPEGAERSTEETAADAVAAPAGRLDSPIERLDLSTPDTFIPEAVDQLLAHSRRYPLLTPAQEIELAQRIERGDLHAKELLVNSNLRLVASNARRYQNQGLPLGDLVQEGMLGLIRAVEKFDWRRGFKFSTYGTLWIRQAIQRGLQNTGRTIRVPVHVAQRQTKLRKLESELATKLSREPTDEELAEVADFPLDEVRELRELSRSLTSLDQTVDDEGETSLGELLPSDRPEPI